mmetsp:Transcript_151778/g.467885  ORF Transcript_151778/g.467885 Transcript_151778/m.467885 type:complete len:352 (+) Transcript_151778:245-1300(+)
MAVFPSPRRHFRMRQNFSIDRCAETGKPVYVWGGPYVPMETFPAASEAICEMMPRLLRRLHEDDVLAEGLSAVHFLSTLSGELVISLFYNTPLHEDWLQRATEARAALGDEATLSVIGHSKGVARTVGRDYVTEVLHLSDGRRLSYRQMVGSFSNPNAYINQDCLGWLCETMQRLDAAYGVCKSSDLLELYCGNGNHTCALAGHFRRVLAVELNKTLCGAATHNLAQNGVSNAKVVAMDSAKFCFRVLRAQVWKDPETQEEYRFRVVLVDPPRQGLDANTLKLVARYDAVVYISCGAEALAGDLGRLRETHEVAHAAFFDHFAYTPHIETALCLVRRGLERLEGDPDAPGG